MNKTWLIIKREYLTRVKKKSFIIMTFLGPILFAGLMFGAIALTMNDDTTYEVLVADQPGVISRYADGDKFLVSRFPDRFKDNDKIRYHFASDFMSTDAFKDSPYNIMIELDDATLNNGQCNFYFKKLPSEIISSDIKSELQESLERFRVSDSLQLDYEKYKRAKLNVNFKEINIEKIGQVDHTQEKAFIGFAFAVLIYMFIFLYGVQVMRGVIEEKTNRIVEVIVSSVKPFQLMMGKVIGIGMVGLTQFAMWVILSSVVSGIGMSLYADHVTSGAAVLDQAQMIQAGQPQGAMMAQMMQNDTIGWIFEINWPLMLGLFVFYFIGGYLLYGSLFAAIGSAADSDTDTQQFMAPITIPLIFGYIVSAMMISNPESSAGTFFSIFPLTSPITMMVKSSIGVNVWTIVLSMVVLIATFIFFIWLAGRIYRVGILMYGKKPTYKELWKWIRYSG
jgi:ABC-2 type transport system permease protein